MRWWLIIEEFGPNIKYIYVVYNIISDILSTLPYMSIDKYEPCTRKDQCQAKKLFTIGRVETTNFIPVKYLKCANRIKKLTNK